MACPFLKEGRARYCHASPNRQLILQGPGTSGAGRCDSPRYDRCDLAVQEKPGRNRCPHLEEVRVQYCGASPLTKLIPFQASELSICATRSYGFCDSYLAKAAPQIAASAPPDLLFSPNHFWLAAEESGLCHVGVDGFLADVVGSVDGVTFVTTHGTHCPTVALTVRGVDWPMMFPNPLLIQRVNGGLRTDARRIAADPYGSGWLFAGWELPQRTRCNLMSGPQAAAWQLDEQDRLAQDLQNTLKRSCDGGKPVRGVGQLVSRQQLVCLLQHFFSQTQWGSKE